MTQLINRAQPLATQAAQLLGRHGGSGLLSRYGPRACSCLPPAGGAVLGGGVISWCLQRGRNPKKALGKFVFLFIYLFCVKGTEKEVLCLGLDSHPRYVIRSLVVHLPPSTFPTLLFSSPFFFPLSHFRYFSQLENSLDFVLEDGKGLFAHHVGLFRDFSLFGVNAKRFEVLCLPSSLPPSPSSRLSLFPSLPSPAPSLFKTVLWRLRPEIARASILSRNLLPKTLEGGEGKDWLVVFLWRRRESRAEGTLFGGGRTFELGLVFSEHSS